MFWNTLIKLCADAGITPNALAKKIGISSGSITSWKRGAVPHDTTLKKIADYFGVPVSYLTGLVDDPDPLTFIFPTEKNKDSPFMKMLGEKMRDMSAAELDEVNRYIDYLISRKK